MGLSRHLHVIRTSLQQLEDAGLVTVRRNAAGTVNMGRILTAEGQKILDAVAHEVRPLAEESYPGLGKY